MPGLGDLVVDLSANTAKFDKKMKTSKMTLSDFGKVGASFLNPVKAGLLALTAGAVSAGVAIYGLTSRIDALDKIAKTAQKTGVSGAFLQRLEFAADQSGVSVDQVSTAIKKLTIVIGQGEADFSSLNLSMEELKRLSPEAQFLKIAEQISKLPTAAERAAAAVKVFGKSGIEMIPLFSDGMEGVVGLMEKARSLGIGIDEAGLAQVQAANDALGQMKAAFTALIDQVVVGLAPGFTLVGTKISELIPPVTELFRKFNSMEGKWQFLGDVIDASITVAIENLKVKWKQMFDEFVGIAASKALEISSYLNPGAAIGVYLGGKLTGAGGTAENPNAGIDAANSRLSDLITKLNSAPAAPPIADMTPVEAPADTGQKLGALMGDAWAGVSSRIEAAKLKAGEAIGAGKLTVNYLIKTAENILTGDKINEPDAKKFDDTPKLAGAMQKGSTEAFSTLMQAMLGPSRDPVVKATEKQTKDLIAGLKPAKPKTMQFIGAGG